MKRKLFWSGAFVYGMIVMLFGSWVPATETCPEPLCITFMAVGFGVMAFAVGALRRG